MAQDEFSVIPKHIAIIMDGNGRWARKRRKERLKGHEEGANTVEEIVTFCAKIGVSYVTLYAFSIDNWRRPRKEVNYLMGLLKKFLRSKTDVFNENGIKFRAIGRREMLPKDVQQEVEKTEDITAQHTKMTLYFALSYSGRTDIVDAARTACTKVIAGELLPQDLTEDVFEQYLDTAGVPDPDIFIRTGGDVRISNFLLWQISYSEMFFTDTLWPDFTVNEMRDIIKSFGKRERRFGGL